MEKSFNCYKISAKGPKLGLEGVLISLRMRLGEANWEFSEGCLPLSVVIAFAGGGLRL